MVARRMTNPPSKPHILHTLCVMSDTEVPPPLPCSCPLSTSQAAWVFASLTTTVAAGLLPHHQSHSLDAHMHSCLPTTKQKHRHRHRHRHAQSHASSGRYPRPTHGPARETTVAPRK
jgi:hypothetical protein